MPGKPFTQGALCQAWRVASPGEEPSGRGGTASFPAVLHVVILVVAGHAPAPPDRLLDGPDAVIWARDARPRLAQRLDGPPGHGALPQVQGGGQRQASRELGAQ